MIVWYFLLVLAAMACIACALAFPGATLGIALGVSGYLAFSAIIALGRELEKEINKRR